MATCRTAIMMDNTDFDTSTSTSCSNGSGRQVTLSQNESTGSTLIDKLWTCYREGIHLDMNIVCREQNYRVHKIVVACFSPILRGYLTSNNRSPNSTSAIQIDRKTGDVRLDYVAEQSQDIGYLIEFMYTGTVSVPRDRVQSLLRMAEILLVKTLINTIMSNHQKNSPSSIGEDDSNITFVHGDHRSHFGETVWNMFNESHVVDSNIVCRELSVRTHKSILIAASNVLRRLLLSTMTSEMQSIGVYESERGIQLDYVAEQTDDVLCLIEFIYRGRTVVSDVRIQNLLQLATKLEVKELMDAISSWHVTTSQNSLSSPSSSSTPVAKKNKKAVRQTKGNYQRGVVNGIGAMSKAERIGDRVRPQHRCHLCPFTSPHKQRLIQHLASIHRLDDRGNSLPDIASKCTLCDFSCTAPHQLTQHYIKSHCKDKPYRCSLCDYATVIESELERHVHNRHPDRQRHECPTCGFLARTKTGLTLHVRMHQRPKPHPCTTCEERFTSLDKLKTHLKRKHGVSSTSVDLQMADVASSNDSSVHSVHQNDVVTGDDVASSGLSSFNADVGELPAVVQMIGFSCPECGVDCQTGEMLRLHIDMYHHVMDNGYPIRGDIVRVVSNEEVTELRVL